MTSWPLDCLTAFSMIGESARVPYALPSRTAWVAGAWLWNVRMRMGFFCCSMQLADFSTSCAYCRLPSRTAILRPQRLRGPKRFLAGGRTASCEPEGST